MAENTPSPPGGPVPPRPVEPPKPAGKKETVRISLPPKPTATIKLPTLPAGAPAASAAGAPPVAHAPGAPPPSARPAPPAPSTGAPAARVAGPPKSAAPAPAASAPPRPASAPPAARRVSGLDFGLAIAAAVIGLGAVGSLFMLLQLK